MAVTKKSVAKWGLRQVAGATQYGVITSLEKIADLMTQNETDESGSVCRVKEYDVRRRMTMTIQTAENTNPPEVGTQITVDGMVGWVLHTEIIEQNQAFKKMRVTMERYAKCDTIG